MALDVGPITPLEALDRRAEWELAALIVALTVIPFVGGNDSPKGRGEPTVATRATSRRGRSRHVRPPRSC